MLEHHLQRAIVYRLAFAESMRFSDLKPDTLENKPFDYHLKKVIAAGYVSKNSLGLYTLTPEGRRLGLRVADTQYMSVDRAYAVLFLVVTRSSDGAWLLYRRKTQPLFGLTGFMHATPNANETVIQTAGRECQEKTGLTGDFTVTGSGYFRVFKDNELESFTHFTLLFCDNIAGELLQDSELADYYWDAQPDFTTTDMLPTMPTLKRLYDDKNLSFVEQTFRL